MLFEFLEGFFFGGQRFSLSLVELCDANGRSAQIRLQQVRIIKNSTYYIKIFDALSREKFPKTENNQIVSHSV